MSEKFLHLPIEKEMLGEMSEYFIHLRANLHKGSDVDVEYTVHSLRNQVLQ